MRTAVEAILKNEIGKLERIVEKAQKRLQSAPKGFLRIARKGECVQYYHKSEDTNNVNGKYIRKDEIKLAKSLAQRDYDLQIMEVAERRIQTINVFLRKYSETCLGKVYEKTNNYRKELIQVVVLPDEEYIKEWQEVEYVGKPFAENAPEILTERGERVRSKSEKIIADKLYALGIPYRYEYPLILDGNVKLYPDFTILKMPEREEVYLEHLGMMDDGDYVNGMLFKLKTYEKNGIYPGVHLFMTLETGREPLNTRALDGLIRSVFGREK